jgi:hypothetical protein
MSSYVVKKNHARGEIAPTEFLRETLTQSLVLLVVRRRMVSPLPVQTRARIRALQARIAEVAAAGGASASAQLDNGSEQPRIVSETLSNGHEGP